MGVKATKWRISGVSTAGGGDLELSQLRLWGPDGAVDAGAVISGSVLPTSGGLGALLISDTTTCRFSAKDMQAPGFYIEITLPTAVEVWSARFAGPTRGGFIETFTLTVGGSMPAQTAPFGSVVFEAPFVLSAAPNFAPKFGRVTEQWALLRSDAWFSCAVSADYQTVIGTSRGNYIVVSKDGGDTWQQITSAGAGAWCDCSIARDGQVMLGVKDNSGSYPWVSKDGGATWQAATTAGARTWRGCSVSGDGTVLLCADGTTLYRSTDGAATWVAIAGGAMYRCAVSNDGRVILAGASPGYLQLSKDGGATFQVITAAGSRGWNKQAVSADGKILLAAAGNSTLFLSRDGGATWQAVSAAGTRDWYACAVSADGMTLLGGANDNYLFMSADGGDTWRSLTDAGTGFWYGCAVSADGSMLLGAIYSGYLKRLFRADPIYGAPSGRARSEYTMSRIAGETPPVAATNSIAKTPSLDMQDGGNGRIYGTVKQKIGTGVTPLRRRVVLIHQRSQRMVRETWSDPATGAYQFAGINTSEVYYTATFDHEGNFRGVVADNLKPEPM